MNLRLAAAALPLFAGCAQAQTPSAGPAVAHVHVRDLPEQAHHVDHHTPAELPPVARADPASVAMRLVFDGLAAQDLTVTDIGADPTMFDPSTASVRVAATFTGPDGRPRTGLYELELYRNPDGTWMPAGQQPDR